MHQNVTCLFSMYVGTFFSKSNLIRFIIFLMYNNFIYLLMYYCTAYIYIFMYVHVMCLPFSGLSSENTEHNRCTSSIR